MTQSKTSTSKSLTLSVSEQGIGWITIDVASETQNTIRADFAAEFEAIFTQIVKDPSIKALVIISGKEDGFIAGADIGMLQGIDSQEAIFSLAMTGHHIFNKLESHSMPVIAAINGACLGGGLELAMACSYRIATDNPSTKLGLPEVQLGLLPGAGGTQRLPRLVGIATSLDLMLTGKQLPAIRAKKIGLVDEVVAPANLRKAAEKAVTKLLGHSKRVSSQLYPHFSLPKNFTASELQKLALETNEFGRKIIFDKAKSSVLKKTQGNYPSPLKIIECVKQGITNGFDAGIKYEAQAFSELVISDIAKQLMNIFFATVELKKDSGVKNKVSTVNIERVGVLGGGLMGAGIAFVTADKANKMVRIKDQDDRGINHALKYCWDIYRSKIKRKHIKLNLGSQKFSRITGSTSYRGFKNCQLVIEAVYENLELKQQMLKDIERESGGQSIFASNTSSIPITNIAAAAKYPEKVIGLHYFSPVEKMPLLEIIVTEKTSDQVIATCVEFGKQQGKTVIVVKDGAGFYTSRILAPFVNEAGHLLAEGVAIEKIDQALQQAGYPIGPIRLLDEVGIDVGTKIAPILAQAFGERMLPPAAFDKLEKDNRKGKKNKRGFYRYDTKSSSKRQVDSSIYQLLQIEPNNNMTAEMIAERCMLQMVNEAAYCFEQGIISSARDGDIGAIFGLGFPPFLGGPFRYADAIGLDKLVQRLQHYQQTCGGRFTPAKVLVKMAKNGGKFYC
ncbi:MAG: fatty acid oxidation complex subunit alpha FadJ [Enterobacterales bacterium]|nr:fatty acid oxidation complex subunit alpha FadJ [Enterobacterales bacterium]